MEYKYYAFISYSHKDKAWCDFIHQSLETYKIPPRLVGTQGREGEIPKRLFPIFRDREELPGSSDLGKNIAEALKASRYLIVVCSKSSAKSLWVNEEIKTFKSLGREDKVLCLIVDGEPNASDKQESQNEECFPEALKFKVDSLRQVTNERVEPIAADVRPGMDGKLNAKLKLIAGIIGVNFDDLKQRDRRRTIENRIKLSVLTVTLLSIFLGLWALNIKKAKDAAKKQAEIMIQKAKEARKLNEEAVATLYAAYSLKYAAEAQIEPIEKEFIESLSLVFYRDQNFKPLQVSSKTAMDPQRKYLAYARLGKMIFKNLKDGKEIEFKGDAIGANLIEFKNQLLVSSHHGKTIKIWNIKKRELERNLTTNSEVSSLALTQDEKILFSGEENGTLKVWDLSQQTGKELFKGRGSLNDLLLIQNDQQVLIAGQDGSLKIFDRLTNKVRDLGKYDESLMSLALDKRNQILALGSWDQTIKLWDLKNLKEKEVLKSCCQSVDTLLFSEDGKTLIYGNQQDKIKIWDMETKLESSSLVVHSGDIVSLHLGPKDQELYSTDADGKVLAWKLVPSKYEATLIGHSKPIRSLVFHPQKEILYSASDDASIKIWDTKTCKELATLKGHFGAIREIALNPTGKILASASSDKTIKLWDTETYKELGTLTGHRALVNGLAFSPDGKYLGSVSWDKSLKLWDVEKQKEIKQFLGHTKDVSRLCFDPKGKLIATASYDETIKIWDVKSGKEIQTLSGHHNPVRLVKFHPQEKILASGSDDGKVIFWNYEKGEVLNELKPYSEGMWVIDFDRKGEKLFTGSRTDDGKANFQIWDTKTLKPMTWVPGHYRFTLAMALNYNEDLLATGGLDNVIHIWKYAKAQNTQDYPLTSPLRLYLLNHDYSPQRANELLEQVKKHTGIDIRDGKIIIWGEVK